MINANTTSRIHLLSHSQILAERLIAVILCSGCLGWDTESPNIKKVCVFSGGWFVSPPGSGQQFGQIVAERRNRLAENLTDPGLGHPENGGDLRELHVFVVVHCQHFFLQLWKLRHALRQQRDYFFPLQVSAKRLLPSSGLRPWTYHCLFGLLAVSGLRISEAIKLDRQDVDFNQGLLTIRQTKFNKSRLIPLHVSTRDVLAEYAQRRDRLVPTQSSPCFLLNDHGRCLESS